MAMKCEICGGDPKLIILLPKRQPGGKLNTFTCESCAGESGMYCQKHQRPHLGFEDETTACAACIEETLAKDGERIAGMFAVAVSQSEKAPQIKQAITDYLEEINLMLPRVDLADLPLAVMFLSTPHALNATRPIIAYALRMEMTPEEVIQKVAKEGPEVIFPQ